MFPNPLRRLPESFVPLLAMLVTSHIAIPLVQGSPGGMLALTGALLLAGVPAVKPSPGIRLTVTAG